jgi:hypothetical protein
MLSTDRSRHGLRSAVWSGGKPFFARGLSLSLKPLGAERLPQDIILLRYAPAG